MILSIFSAFSGSSRNIPVSSQSRTIASDQVMAFWHSPTRVGLYLEMMGCQSSAFNSDSVGSHWQPS